MHSSPIFNAKDIYNRTLQARAAMIKTASQMVTMSNLLGVRMIHSHGYVVNFAPLIHLDSGPLVGRLLILDRDMEIADSMPVGMNFDAASLKWIVNVGDGLWVRPLMSFALDPQVNEAETASFVTQLAQTAVGSMIASEIRRNLNLEM